MVGELFHTAIAKQFEITRNGAKGDSQTTYTILPEAQIPDGWKPSLQGLKMHDLAKLAGGKSSAPAAAPAPVAGSDPNPSQVIPPQAQEPPVPENPAEDEDLPF